MNQRIEIPFPGGLLSLDKPSQADLILSAKQWAQRAKDELSEADNEPGTWNDKRRKAALSALDHMMRAIAEIQVDPAEEEALAARWEAFHP